jgi:hypothetical protein
MASTTQAPQASNGSTNLPTHRTSSSNYVDTQTAKAEQDKLISSVKIPDGRRNSMGETLPSPTETWKPNLARNQSWNQEDLKRKYVMTELEKDKSVQGGGFTEVGEGSRKI